MSPKQSRNLLSTSVVPKQKMKLTSNASATNELRFQADQANEQRVTVFDSSAVPEPFMNPNLLAAIKEARGAPEKQ